MQRARCLGDPGTQNWSNQVPQQSSPRRSETNTISPGVRKWDLLEATSPPHCFSNVVVCDYVNSTLTI